MYIIRHQKPYRTRLTFAVLKGHYLLCRKVQEELASAIEGCERVQVKPPSGSVILEHAKGPVPCAEIENVVRKMLEKVPERGRHKDREEIQQHRNHVSATGLIVTGIYLLYLGIKRWLTGSPVTAPAIISRFISLPALTALWLSIPIQRQAIDNFRESGKPDTGMISTALLYVSIAMGNVLAVFTIFWLYNVSNWLEQRIQVRTRRAVREMLTGKSTTAWLLKDGIEIEVETSSLQSGDIISLQSGNRVPVDGVVEGGVAVINESTLTGEELPVEKSTGAQVFAGTMVEEGALQVKVAKTGEETRLASILRIIENAEQDIGELQRTSRMLSIKLVPYTLGLAAAAFLLTGNPIVAVTVLIVTCPCALRLSTSVTISAAMSNGAQNGIFIKGGRYVETAGRVNVLVLDKTGTITDPVSEVHHIEAFGTTYGPEDILQLAASVQKTWQHPLGRAVMHRAKEDGIVRLPCDQAQLVVGRGIKATVSGREVLVGSCRFMQEHDVAGIQGAAEREAVLSPGAGLLYVASSGQLIGSIETGSPLRENMTTIVEQLKAIGFARVVLLTGDSETGARVIRKQLSFDEVHYQQSPEDKAAWISSWKKMHPHDVVAMVGDGVNDTPAFAIADLSLAIGHNGADIAMEYADIVLHSGEAEQLISTFTLGQEAIRLIRQNHALAIGLNGLTLAGMLTNVISPVSGALVHNLITFGVVSNGAGILTYS
ncbi:MAG: hypothetical protein CSA20_02125 [Deltaproteobacteria bacterium]|nr:MAG: hypothetical protein CSA20_02125 [Deltaproteobacteria bacterium]